MIITAGMWVLIAFRNVFMVSLVVGAQHPQEDGPQEEEAEEQEARGEAGEEDQEGVRHCQAPVRIWSAKRCALRPTCLAQREESIAAAAESYWPFWR